MKLDNDRMCNKYIWKCKKCNSVGCDNRDCKKQNFDPGNGMCLACNQTGARVSV